MSLVRLSQGQVASLVGLGTFYWGAAALALREGGPILFANDCRRVATYLGLAPVAYALVVSPEKIFGIAASHRLTSTAVMSATAMILDGVALMWFPSLYENPALKKTDAHAATTTSRMAAASLLFGVGLSFGWALTTR